MVTRMFRFRKFIVMLVIFFTITIRMVVMVFAADNTFYQGKPTFSNNIRIEQVYNENRVINRSLTWNELLLARLINSEAEGESYEGKVAVGAVVLNRLKSKKFPNTIADVIYQEHQFSGVGEKHFNKYPTEESIRAALDALEGKDPTNGALYFANLKKCNPKWVRNQRFVKRIGDHWFYKSVS